MKGLDPEKKYRLEGAEDGRIYTGDTLLKAGIRVENPWGDFKARLLHFVEV